jgi:hypothetical protein
MTTSFAYETIGLDPASARSVPTVRGVRIRVVDGLVWATTTGDTRDLWLRRGDEFTVARNGRTVLESNARSTIELLAPRTSGTWAAALFAARMSLQRIAQQFGAAGRGGLRAGTAIGLAFALGLGGAVGTHVVATDGAPPASRAGASCGNDAPLEHLALLVPLRTHGALL